MNWNLARLAKMGLVSAFVLSVASSGDNMEKAWRAGPPPPCVAITFVNNELIRNIASIESVGGVFKAPETLVNSKRCMVDPRRGLILESQPSEACGLPAEDPC